jgi:acetolactate synthase-1/2/3 large subunit
MRSGADLFVETLLKLGIRDIFTLVGDHLNDVLPAAARAGIRIIDMRHESGVTHAADCWARIHRRPAVALVTGGPGHTNALTGIATAQLMCSPLIAISGSRGSAAAERGAFQDIDQVGMAKPVVKWAAEPPNAAQIPFYLHRAYDEANSGRKGAVHLTIPVDLFSAKAEAVIPEVTVSSEPSVDPGAALALLHEAQRPVVIAGSGVWWADAAAELRAFIEHTKLPLYTITMARGMVSDDHPLCFGYADPALNRAALRAFQLADVVLLLGKRVDYRMAMGGPRLFSPNARFIQVDVHPQELGINRRIEVAVAGDVKTFLRNATQGSWTQLPWLDQLRQFRCEWEAAVAGHASNRGSPLHPAAFFAELKKWIPDNVVYSWDGGDFVHWGRVTLPARESGTWMRLGPLGTIGSALPNALALKMATPERPIILITGDGSLGFYLAELDSAVRHNLPFVVIVGNDGGWGLERELQHESGEMTVACELRQTRYDIITQGFGGGGEVIESLEQVGPALQRGLAAGVPYCLNVMIRGVRSPFTEWQAAGKKK